MLRTPIIAALTVALLGGTALAAPAASAPPATLSDSARNAPDFDDEDAGPPPSARAYAQDDRPGPAATQANPQAQMTADAQRDRDIFCRRDAAARTGYTTPGEAAHDEQVKGTVGGTLGLSLIHI